MTPPVVIDVTDATFEKEVLKSDKLVLIDFHAVWCGPCKGMAPGLEKFAEENQATVKVVKVNVDENPRLVQAFKIRAMPTLAVMKDNNVIFLAAGARSKTDLEKIVAGCFKALAAQPAPDANKHSSKPPTL